MGIQTNVPRLSGKTSLPTRHENTGEYPKQVSVITTTVEKPASGHDKLPGHPTKSRRINGADLA